MEREREEQLINYLAKNGFEGDDFVFELRNMMGKDLPGFSLKYQRQFNEDKMFYSLRFVMDKQFQEYRLTGYRATHRRPVWINHKNIDGINTADIEATMASLPDWETYFHQKNKLAEGTAERYSRVLDQLGQIAGTGNINGVEIQGQLMYKYFSERDNQHFSKEHLTSIYERSRNFEAQDEGICSAQLAFNIMSGALDRLYNLLEPSNLPEISQHDLYNELSNILSGEVDDFIIRRYEGDHHGYIDYELTISREGNEYLTGAYRAIFTAYQDINHGKFAGIDTKLLETKMASIDWKYDAELYSLKEGLPEFSPKVSEVLEQINILGKHPMTADIADQLILKYWIRSPLFETLIGDETWQYLDQLPSVTQDFPIKVDMRLAKNLLAGRSVLEDLLQPSIASESHWVRLDLSNDSFDGRYPLLSAGAFSKADIEQQLNLIPLDRKHNHSFFLLRGDLLEEKLLNGKHVFIEALPDRKQLQIYNEDGRVIPLNLGFDPDWKPDPISAVSQADMTTSVQKKPDIKRKLQLKKSKNHRRKL